MRGLLTAILVTAICLAAVSCRGERDYSRWTELPPEGWAYGDTLRLVPVDTSLQDNDSIVSRSLRLGLAHSNDYPYSNIWLEVTYYGDGTVCRDTLNVGLADVYGRWLGSGFGSDYQREVELSPSAEIDITRPVSVRHIMRVDTLRGVDRVGISVR